jgi:hypothetical protein
MAKLSHDVMDAPRRRAAKELRLSQDSMAALSSELLSNLGVT